jgi:autotransporter passenger strand-loop-strand repeat protein
MELYDQPAAAATIVAVIVLNLLSGGSQTDLGATIATVLFGGTETVSSGGTASNTVVLSGGSLIVLSHGLADSATIYAGGSETISKGGTGPGAQISGSIQVVSGVASGATIFAGSQMIRSAGTGVGTTVSNDATPFISGPFVSLGRVVISLLSWLLSYARVINAASDPVAAAVEWLADFRSNIGGC